jgi:hypothetical protein
MYESADGPDGADDDTDQSSVTILDTSTVSQGGRISLVDAVQEAFAERGIEIEEGDRIVYVLRDENIVIEPAKSPSNR